MALTLGSVKTLVLSPDPNRKRRDTREKLFEYRVQTQMNSLLRQGPSGEDTAPEWPSAQKAVFSLPLKQRENFFFSDTYQIKFFLSFP